MQPSGPEIKEFVSCSKGRTSPHFGESQDVLGKKKRIPPAALCFALQLVPPAGDVGSTPDLFKLESFICGTLSNHL